MSEHKRWTVEHTSYLRNLSRDDLREDTFAIYHEDPPRHDAETGSTTFSLRFPALIGAGYIEQPEQALRSIANRLNATDAVSEALEWIAHNFENTDINHVDFRVEAKARADAALAALKGEPQ